MMVDRAILIEIMAEAIGRAIGGAGWWAVAKHDAREATRREAAAAIEALEAGGYAVVPRELSNDAVSNLAGDGIPAETVRVVHGRLIAAAS